MANDPGDDKPAAKDPLLGILVTVLQFLVDAFTQMPPPVRVVAYLTLLFVFTATILVVVFYPVFGVTYFQIRLAPLADDALKAALPCDRAEDLWPRCLVRSLRVSRSGSSPVYTNDDGDFTFPVRMVNLPLVQPLLSRLVGSVEFDIEKLVLDREKKRIRAVETVEVPPPAALLSLFNPNPQKVYYVPLSRVQNHDGTEKHYFTDRNEAVQARKGAVAGLGPDGAAADAGPAARWRWSVPAVAAIEQSYREPTFTLRIHRLRLAGDEPASELYFVIFVDGERVEVKGIPGERSAPVERVTVVSGSWMALEEFDIPVKQAGSTVKISAVRPRRFLRILGDEEVGSVTAALGGRVGTRTTAADARMEIEWELLPPVAIASVAVRGSAGRTSMGYWLEVPPGFTEHVKDCLWVKAGGLDSAAGRRHWYGGAVAASGGDVLVRARVVFTSGSQLRLASLRPTTPVVPSRPTELYVATDLYRGMGDARRALEVVEQATKIRPAPIWALQAKGAILRDIEQYRESADAYRAALDLDPGDVASRVGHALTLAEWPESQPSDLRAALQLVDESLRRYPSYAWARIARGMLQIRLGEVRAGLQTLAAVRDAEAKIGPVRAASLVQIDYYMGIAYQRLGQPADARRAFSKVAPDDATADGSSGLATAKYVRKARGLLERS